MNQRLEGHAVSDASAVGMSSTNSTEKTCRCINKDFCGNLLPFVYPHMIEALHLKTIEIRVSFIPVQARKNWLKVGIDKLIPFSTLFVIPLSRFLPDKRNIAVAFHIKMLP